MIEKAVTDKTFIDGKPFSENVRTDENFSLWGFLAAGFFRLLPL